MRTLRNIRFWTIIALSEIVGCKKPYAPTITASNVSYLVVDGVINSGQDSTIIKLSHTVNISGNVNASPELNATVTVEDDQNATHPLSDAGQGKYVSAALNLDTTHKYHLHIRTAEGKEYLSDYEAVKYTPPIDSIGFTIKNTGVQLYVNTHDANNSTRYYHWDYSETWKFNTKYQALYITDGTKLRLRKSEEQIFTCFANDVSSTIILGSSANLSRDIIYQNPVTQIASTSEKLESKYSVLLKQYALTKDAFAFWQNMKKSSEELGTIFDAQPTSLKGNIHCVTNPSEPVIGYISVTNIQQKRIFISNDQLPSTWRTIYPYDCTADSLLFGNSKPDVVDQFLIAIPPADFGLGPITDKSGQLLGYVGANAQCTDCTIRGTVKQPDFWK